MSDIDLNGLLDTIEEVKKESDNKIDFPFKEIAFDESGEFTLSDEQKDKIKDIWANSSKANPPSVRSLASSVFGREVPLRDPRVKIMKKYLAEIDFKAPDYEKPVEETVELNEEQKEFIDNNFALNKSPLELTRTIFSNITISSNSPENKAVINHIQNQQAIGKLPTKHTTTYTTPQTISSALSRIKKYVAKVDWSSSELKDFQKKCLESIINYMSTMRYLNQILSYDQQEDRELFESEFIRCTYDKPDLSEEDIDQYIIYSNEVIVSKNILKNINKFQTELNEDFDNQDDDHKKMSMSLVEMISGMRNEYNASIKRQQELLKTLTVNRSQRIANQKAETASIVNLVNAWKDEEFRKKTILLAKRRQEALKETIKEYTSMDELKARIFGVTEEDILNG